MGREVGTRGEGGEEERAVGRQSLVWWVGMEARRELEIRVCEETRVALGRTWRNEEHTPSRSPT